MLGPVLAVGADHWLAVKAAVVIGKIHEKKYNIY